MPDYPIIDGKTISPDHPPYIIAEKSRNHNGKLERAISLIEAAKRAGADAVKLQTYTADTITLNSNRPEFMIQGGLWDGKRLYDLYAQAYTPWEWHEALFAKGKALGITVFSSPFDPTAVDFLESIGCPAYKIASFELIDLPLIAKASRTGKPIIMSTGMATLGEIDDAVATARANGCQTPILLHCTSGYPTPIHEANLRTIPHLSQAFSLPVGLSDHTPGISAPVAAVSIGACVIEKHFTLRRADGGPDAAFSLEAEELALLSSSCRDAWMALGKVTYLSQGSEQLSLPYRRSLYVCADIAEGELFTSDNIRSVRPGLGVAPRYLPDFIGKRAARALSYGTPLRFDMIEREKD